MPGLAHFLKSTHLGLNLTLLFPVMAIRLYVVGGLHAVDSCEGTRRLVTTIKATKV